MRRLYILALIMLASSPYRASANFRSDTILSVLRWKDVVFASTRTGLFRSSPSDQSWIAVALPPGTKPGGCLNSTDSGTSEIYYSPPVKPVSDIYDHCPSGLGLWVSKNLGQTWEHVDAVHLFHSVFLHSSGFLYASAAEASEKSNVEAALETFARSPFVSSDGGRTWHKTEGAEHVPSILNLGPCETNPEHICGTGLSIRLYCLEYAPEQKKWTIIRAPKPVDQLTSSEFLAFHMSTGTSPCCYELRPNLENYYRASFGESLQKAGIVIVADKGTYHFKKEGRKIVHVTMRLLSLDPPIPELAVPDVDRSQACWGLKIVEPDGMKTYVAPAGNSMRDATLRVHVLRPGRSYRRVLNVQALTPLEKPGVYKAALIFDNSKLVKQNKEEWTGYFTGPPFEIVVAPQ